MSKILDQSKLLSREKTLPKHENPWDVAIAEAEQRIKDFKYSIKVFKRMKAKGVAWRDKKQQKASTKEA